MALSTSIASFGQNQKADPITYPVTKKGETVDVYFDTRIPDPYRWLEDDKSAETAAWVKEQNKVTYDYLSKIPFRDALKARLEKLWNYEKVTAPFKEGNFIYYYKNVVTPTETDRKTFALCKEFEMVSDKYRKSY